MAKQCSPSLKKQGFTPQEKKLYAGVDIIKKHPLFRNIIETIQPVSSCRIGKQCFAKVSSDGTVYLNKEYDMSPEEWAFCIAHNLLHLAFGHFDAENMPGVRSENGTWIVSCNKSLWNMACDLYINRFLSEMKFGGSIVTQSVLDSYPYGNSEIELYQKLSDRGYDPLQNSLGTASPQKSDMIGLDQPLVYAENEANEFAENFAYYLSLTVRATLWGVQGKRPSNQYGRFNTIVRKIMNQIPLLGALASGFRIVDVSEKTAAIKDVEIAAVDVTRSEIYVNSYAGLSSSEWLFVLAHEYLHAGLQHHARRQGRNPYLWNVACDYVVNGWLVEIGIGKMPEAGLLYDETLRDCSAEEIYDRLITDIRKNTKLKTLRGYSKGDIIANGWTPDDRRYVTLDEFYKNALRNGLEYASVQGRGLIPAGLVEEIQALSMPPIPWDVELARWFEIHFPTMEMHRNYAHPSRRQSSTPNIPRAGWMRQAIPERSRTFGVIIDTSGSMPPSSIGLALGATASYSVAKEVPYVRLVFCDAAPTDLGYVTPEEIAGRVEVTGRGGTQLQPAINLLEHADDFPDNAPILIITDSDIEPDLRIRHEHAFLIPFGRHLPFKAQGEIFYFKEREDGNAY